MNIAVNNVSNIALQDTSKDIWESKYQLKDHSGNPVDQTVDDTLNRVAVALASVEKDPNEHIESFKWALSMGAVPAGRILANAGAEKFKTAVSLINCTVSQTIHDSMDDILHSVHQAGLTLKSGAGIGYEFSTIRPKGAFVSGAGAKTNGPLSFMDIFDSMCFTVSSAGGRRGAQMATFDISHPDVEEFIQAKRENGRLRQFNLSLLITSDFIDAVKNDLPWKLVFPASKHEIDSGCECVERDWPVDQESYTKTMDGKVICRVYREVKARDLWHKVMKSTYDFAEPGFILVDEVNEMNNNWFCEEIRATNPCGEQPLPPNGACLLGSVNLTKFVVNPFTEAAYFDFDSFAKVVKIFTRMLDNVVEISALPLPQQQAEIESKRRHGMGFFGLGSALSMMCIPYGSHESTILTSEISKVMAITGWEEGVRLSLEKGEAPVLAQDFTVTPKMLRKRPEMVADGFKVGDVVKGRILHSRYSRYMQNLAKMSGRDDLIESMSIYGCRFTHHTSIAPTGTIALSLGNNASNGIEPSFSHSYFRNVIKEGKKTKEQVEVASFELLAFRKMVDPDVKGEDLPSYFKTSDSITPQEHVRVQAAAQKWIDSAISKTINVPTEYPFEDFQQIYMFAVESGLKGCTTFRFNPDAFQGVLVKEDDLKNTTYVFHLEDGSQIELAGNESVEYDGETHTAANLYDAIKEGTYGKF